MLGNFVHAFVVACPFFQKNSFRIRVQTVWIQIRPNIFCQAWSGSKLLANFISKSLSRQRFKRKLYIVYVRVSIKQSSYFSVHSCHTYYQWQPSWFCIFPRLVPWTGYSIDCDISDLYTNLCYTEAYSGKRITVEGNISIPFFAIQKLVQTKGSPLKVNLYSNFCYTEACSDKGSRLKVISLFQSLLYRSLFRQKDHCWR